MSKSRIGNIIRAKNIRETFKEDGLGSSFSTDTMLDIAPLPKAHQAKVLKKIRDIDKSKIFDSSQKIEGIKEELLYLQGLF